MNARTFLRPLRGLLILAVGVGVGIVWGRSTVINSAGTLPPEQVPAPTDITAQLGARVSRIDMNDGRLQDAFRAIELASAVRLDVRWNSLEENSIDRNCPIRLSVTDGTVETALRAVFADLASRGQPTLRWSASEDGLRIEVDDGELSVPRLYEVGEVLERMRGLSLVRLNAISARLTGKIVAADTVPGTDEARKDQLIYWLATSPDISIHSGCFGWSNVQSDFEQTLVVHVSQIEQERVRRRLNELSALVTDPASK